MTRGFPSWIVRWNLNDAEKIGAALAQGRREHIEQQSARARDPCRFLRSLWVTVAQAQIAACDDLYRWTQRILIHHFRHWAPLAWGWPIICAPAAGAAALPDPGAARARGALRRGVYHRSCLNMVCNMSLYTTYCILHVTHGMFYNICYMLPSCIWPRTVPHRLDRFIPFWSFSGRTQC